MMRNGEQQLPSSSRRLQCGVALLLALGVATGCSSDSIENASPPIETPEAVAMAPVPANTTQETKLSGPAGWPDPHTACAFLDDRGLATSGYKHSDGDEWGCIATRLTTFGEVAVPDEVTYMLTGNRTELKEIRITAEHFSSNPGDEDFTRGRAWIAAETVSENILGPAMPKEALAAFHKGKKGGTWVVNRVKVVVERDPYPTGKGYAMRFRLSPATFGQ